MVLIIDGFSPFSLCLPLLGDKTTQASQGLLPQSSSGGADAAQQQGSAAEGGEEGAAATNNKSNFAFVR